MRPLHVLCAAAAAKGALGSEGRDDEGRPSGTIVKGLSDYDDGLAQVVSQSGYDRKLVIQGSGLCEKYRKFGWPLSAVALGSNRKWPSSAVAIEFDPPLEAGVDYDIWRLSASEIQLKRRLEKKWRLEPGYLLLKSLQCPGGPKVTFNDGDGVDVAYVKADGRCDDSCTRALDGVCDDGSVPAGCDKRGDGHGRIVDGHFELCPGYVADYGYYDDEHYYDAASPLHDDYDDDDWFDFDDETAPACKKGTDCTDCKVVHGFWRNAQDSYGAPINCANTCESAGDGVCDDPRGTSKCLLGTDCQDCGPRFAGRAPPRGGRGPRAVLY